MKEKLKTIVFYMCLAIGGTLAPPLVIFMLLSFLHDHREVLLHFVMGTLFTIFYWIILIGVLSA